MKNFIFLLSFLLFTALIDIAFADSWQDKPSTVQSYDFHANFDVNCDVVEVSAPAIATTTLDLPLCKFISKDVGNTFNKAKITTYFKPKIPNHFLPEIRRLTCRFNYKNIDKSTDCYKADFNSIRLKRQLKI